MRISDWSSDVCSSDLRSGRAAGGRGRDGAAHRPHRRRSGRPGGARGEPEAAMAKLKLGVLISGRGSNLQALLDRAAEDAYPAEVALVISNNADALGLQRAEAAGAPPATIDHRGFPERAAFEAKLDERSEEHTSELQS